MARHHMEQDELAFQYTYFWKDTWGNDKTDTYNIDLAALRQGRSTRPQAWSASFAWWRWCVGEPRGNAAHSQHSA